MSDVVLVALIAAVSSMVAALISAFALIQTRQTHTLINSRMDQLLKMAATLARAEGVAQGEQSQRDRQSAPVE
jgi:hypothetical protein